MYCGPVRLSVCLSVRGRMPTLLHVPGYNLAEWQGMPPSCALLGGFAIRARVALLWQHNANPSYKLASIPRYDDMVRTAGWAGSARVAGGRRGAPPKPRAAYGKRARPVRRRPAADRGVLNITAAVWNAGFHWWRSANKSERKMLASTCLYSLYAWFTGSDVVDTYMYL